MSRNIIILFASLVFSAANAQEHFCAKSKQVALQHRLEATSKMASAGPQISHEMKYDMKFVHLDLKIERNSKYLSGNVKTVATVTVPLLDTFMTLLHQNFVIDSISLNNTIQPFTRKDSAVKVKTPVPLSNSTTFTVIVYYKGTAPTGGSAIGSGFSTGTSGAWGNQATWSLSESFVAYHWWPCKQVLTDKIDSSWVFITTDSLNKAGSNGLLTNVVKIGNKKRFEWKSKTPIDYYLISIAVAKYKEYNLYAKPQYLTNDSILIQNYIYDNAFTNSSWISSQKPSLDKMPQVMNFLCDMFGMYPFYKEKYGHCMAPFSGGMEHQTMTSLGFFSYYLNAHELGHQWWGDNVTCKSWGDIWINEGFASYTEHLVAEYLDPVNFATNLNDAHNNVMSQAGGSIHFTGKDTLNTPRIFSSRLTYDKGGAIVHSLRFLTNNDSVWFNTLRGFQNTYKDATASTVDFKNYYETQTGINATQFFDQWYYGQGYPTFDVKYNFNGSTCFIKSSQTTSMPSVTPLFITPLEYKIKRAGKADTTIRVMHNQSVENYSFSLTGSITSMVCDPNNWIINRTVGFGPARDITLGETSTVGLSENSNLSKIKLAPNPTQGPLAISYPGNDKGIIKIYDLNGKLLIQQQLETENHLDLGQKTSGIYLLEITDLIGNVFYSEKIIKL